MGGIYCFDSYCGCGEEFLFMIACSSHSTGTVFVFLIPLLLFVRSFRESTSVHVLELLPFGTYMVLSTLNAACTYLV